MSKSVKDISDAIREHIGFRPTDESISESLKGNDWKEEALSDLMDRYFKHHLGKAVPKDPDSEEKEIFLNLLSEKMEVLRVPVKPGRRRAVSIWS